MGWSPWSPKTVSDYWVKGVLPSLIVRYARVRKQWSAFSYSAVPMSVGQNLSVIARIVFPRFRSVYAWRRIGNRISFSIIGTKRPSGGIYHKKKIMYVKMYLNAPHDFEVCVIVNLTYLLAENYPFQAHFVHFFATVTIFYVVEDWNYQFTFWSYRIVRFSIHHIRVIVPARYVRIYRQFRVWYSIPGRFLNSIYRKRSVIHDS